MTKSNRLISAIFWLLLAVAVTGSLRAQQPTTYRLGSLVDSTLAVAASHYRASATTYAVRNGFPATVYESGPQKGQVKTVEAKHWVSGFYPGTLWYLYEATGDTTFLRSASAWTAGLSTNQYLTNTHDLGFMMYSSYGNGYRLTGRQAYRDVLLQSATSLSTRYNPTVGSLKSWDWGGNRWAFPVIVDNLMNLELLTAAARLGDRPTYRQQAMQHAETTKANHFRDDYSSYHVVDYDPASGEVLAKMTYQGYDDSSLWARGQAWAIYGYTMLFRELGDSSYLDFANKLLTPYLTQLPEDLVPYWDFDDPAIPNAPRDASAAAIVASALLELHALDSANATSHLRLAERMLESLSGPSYLAPPGTNANFLLLHATGNKPAGREIDVPLVYADYYLVEALLRYRRLATNFSDAIQSVSFAEDAGPYFVVDNLPTLFALPEGTTYATEIRQFNENLDLRIDSASRLVVTAAADYYGSSRAELLVTTSDTTIAFAFDIEVTPVNDAPAPFALTNPPSQADLASGNIQFRWEEAQDVDGDTLSYSLHLATTGFDTTFAGLQEPRLRFPGEGLLQQGATYSWHVLATDGQLTTTSDTITFTLDGTVPTTDPGAASVKLTVYPNPTSQSVTLTFTAGRRGLARLTIHDLSGRQHLSVRYPVSSGTNAIRQPLDLPPGAYIYTLHLPGRERGISGRLLKLQH